MKTLIFSKEIKKRQKLFPWLKIFMEEMIKTFPHYEEKLNYLIENVENEITTLSDNEDHKIKNQALFETIYSLFLHFWWKIRWAKNRRWKNYWKIDAPYTYYYNDFTKYVGKLLYFLIYLGIILSKGDSNSIWINQILQAIHFFPDADGIVYTSLLQIIKLKKEHRRVYMEILKHVLCTEVPFHINEPTVYLKSVMLYKRLRNLIEDDGTKAVLSTAAKIKPPPNLIPWLLSFKIKLKPNENIMDQLFKKKSNRLKKLYKVLLDAELSYKHDSLSEILENKGEKKITIEKDKSFIKNSNSQAVLNKVHKRSKKMKCFKMKKSKLNKNRTLIDTDNNSIKLSCTSIDSFSDTKSQIKDISKIKSISKRKKYEKSNSVELNESTSFNSLPSSIDNCNFSFEEKDIRNRASSYIVAESDSVSVPDTCKNDINSVIPLNLDFGKGNMLGEHPDKSNVRKKQIPDKPFEQCASNASKSIEAVSIKSNYQDGHIGNITSGLYNLVHGDNSKNQVHAVSNQAIDNYLNPDLNLNEGTANINTVQDTDVEIHYNADGNNSINFKSSSHKNSLQNNRIKRKVLPHKRARKRFTNQVLECVNKSSMTDESSTSKEEKKYKSKRKINDVLRSDNGLDAESVLNNSGCNIEISNTENDEIIHLNQLPNFNSNHDNYLTKGNECSISCKSSSICNSKLDSNTIQQNNELKNIVSSGKQIKEIPKFLQSDIADKSSRTDNNKPSKQLKKMTFQICLNPLTDDYLDIEIISEIPDLGVEISDGKINKSVNFSDSSRLLPNCGDSVIQVNKSINDAAPPIQNTFVYDELTSTLENSVCYEASEISRYEDEESGISDLNFNRKDQQKCNKVPIKKPESNLFDTNIQNVGFEHHVQNKMLKYYDNSVDKNCNCVQWINDISNGEIQETNMINHNQSNTNVPSFNSSVFFSSRNEFNFGLQNTNRNGLMAATTLSTTENKSKQNEVDSLLNNTSNSKSNFLLNNNSVNCRTSSMVTENINLKSKDCDDYVVNISSGRDSFKRKVTVCAHPRNTEVTHQVSGYCNSYQSMHPISKIDQQIKLLPRNVNHFEESSPLLRADNELYTPPSSERNVEVNSKYFRILKNSTNRTYQTLSSEKSQFSTPDNINECVLNEFDKNSNLLIKNEFQSPKSVKYNKNIQKIRDTTISKMGRKKRKLTENNLKQVYSYQNSGYKIYSDTVSDMSEGTICLSSDVEIDDSFILSSDLDTSPSLFPSQKSNVATCKDYKRKLFVSAPCLQVPEKCKSNLRTHSSNFVEMCDESCKSSANTQENSVNHTYNLRKRRSTTIRRK